MTSHGTQRTDTTQSSPARLYSGRNDTNDPSLSSTTTKNHRLSWNTAKNRRSRTLSTTSAAKRYLQQIVSSQSFNSSVPPEHKAPETPALTNLTNTLAPPLPPLTTPTTPTTPTAHRPRPTSIQLPARSRSPQNTNMARSSTVIGGGNSGIPSHANSALNNQSANNNSTASLGRSSSPALAPIRHGRAGSVGSLPLTSEKPVASTSGGAISVTISLAEPILFLQGFEHNNQNGSTPALLRGSLVLRLAKAAKIKAVSLSFKGRARTEWPEGIPPRKSDFYEEKEIMTHTWPFFNAQFPTAELGHGADSARIYGKEETKSNPAIAGAIGSLARNSSPIGMSAAASVALASDKRLSLQSAQSRSLQKADTSNQVSVAQKGFRLFQPGDYIYNFELPVESVLPESISCDLGGVRYELEATIERAGAFRPNLVGKKDVVLIRCPSEGSLEQVEPIAISRNWEDQLHYDIVISGKSFPLGSTIPIAFKLTPLAKVRCHRIKIFITENVEYFCRNKKVHRIEPARKIQLFEKRADGPVAAQYPGSTVRIISGGPSRDPFEQSGSTPNGNDSLLGDLTGDSVGPTEMEFTVQLPGCGSKDKDRLHFDTTYQNIQVHHWIKIVMRLSKTDPNDSTKRRHFEISIDSPFHILSCKCSQANTALPAYNDSRAPLPPSIGSCACPLLQRRNSPLGDTATLQDTVPDMPMPAGNPRIENGGARPMHLLRAPSFNPPPFEADVAPPPLMTPPPMYDSVYSNTNGLADYFARLADEIGDDDDTEDEDHMRLPRTPGGRLVRSMDERRTWDPIGRAV